MAVLLLGCEQEATTSTASTASETSKPAKVVVPVDRLGAFAPLPPAPKLESPTARAKVQLGHMLFFDKRLSKDQDVSCNTCHGLHAYGVDGKAVSAGHKGQKGSRNAPTVYNAASHIAQFWDGRAGSVEDQAKAPLLNPIEMAMPDEGAVLAVLKSMPGYVEAFGKAFPADKTPIAYDNVGAAVGAFERQLVTPAPWDAFLRGDKGALDEEQKRGLLVFMDAGCPTCHNGTLVGGSTYQKAGAVKPWPNQKDTGREAITKNPADRMMFKVPSLRNVAKTAPYFHDASADTLTQAVKKMAKHQLARKFSDEDAQLIVTWLHSLTGEIPKQFTSPPELPARTDKTPKSGPG